MKYKKIYNLLIKIDNIKKLSNTIKKFSKKYLNKKQIDKKIRSSKKVKIKYNRNKIIKI